MAGDERDATVAPSIVVDLSVDVTGGVTANTSDKGVFEWVFSSYK